MRTRTLLVPAPRAPRPVPSAVSRVGWLSPRELDLLMYTYEASVLLPDDDAPAIPAIIPPGATAHGMYFTARRLDIVGLIAMETTTRPTAEHGYNAHHYPTQYTWELTLTRRGQERVAREMARHLPCPQARTHTHPDPNGDV